METQKKINLQLIHGFGANMQFSQKDNVSVLNDNHILFQMGRHIAIKTQQDMNFIRYPDDLDKITCVRVSDNRQKVVIGYTSTKDKQPYLYIHFLNEPINQDKRIFRYDQTKSTQFTTLAFTGGDSRFLCAYTNSPDYTLIYIDISKLKILASYGFNQSINRIQVNPFDTHMITIVGDGLFKNLAFEDDTMIPLPNKINQQQNFTDCAWFNRDKLILTNDQGEIIVIYKNEIIQTIPNGFKEDQSVQALQCFNIGFIVCSECGKFALWVLEDLNNLKETIPYILQRKWQGNKNQKISYFSISKQEDLVAISFKTNDIATFQLSNILPQNYQAMEIQRQLSFQKEVKYEYIYNGFHSGQITSMDVCMQRPLFVTACKQDSSIKVWNYKNYKCILTRKFTIGEDNFTQDANPLLSVTFHPSGYYLAAGFTDKIRFFHLLHTELRTYREINIKNSVQMKFSNGGHLISVVSNKPKTSSYDIIILNSFTLDSIYQLKAHTALITDMHWSKKDNYLYTCGHDGKIIEIPIYFLSQNKEFVQQGGKLNSICITPEHLLLCSGHQQDKNNDKNTIYVQRVFNDQADIKQTFQDYYTTINTNDYKITALCGFDTNKHELFGIIKGTSTGQIRLHQETLNSKPLDVQQVHLGGITKIRSSPDSKFIFTAGDDGCIFIFYQSVVFQEGAQEEKFDQMTTIDHLMKNDKQSYVDDELADVLLVPIQEIEQYLVEQKKLRNDVEDLENRMEIKLQDEQRQRNLEKEQSKNILNLETQKWAKRYEELKLEKIRLEKSTDHLLKHMENNHIQSLEEIEGLYEKKLQIENDKYNRLENKIKENQIKFQDKQKFFEKKQAQTLDNLHFEFKDKFETAQKIFSQTKNTATDIKLIYEENLKQQEEEHEDEIKNLKQQYQNERELTEKEISKYKLQNDMFTHDNKLCLDENERVKSNEADKNQKLDNLTQKLTEAQSQIIQIQRELELQAEKLNQKDKLIYEFKYMVNDLQKSKHILTYRTAEMRKSLEPKEAQIDKLKQELFKLEAEFESILKTTRDQADQIKLSTQQIETLQNNYKEAEETVNKKQNLTNKILMDIYTCVKEKDKKVWADYMIQMYKKYVYEFSKHLNVKEQKGTEEMIRQISHLENVIENAQESSQKKIYRRETDIRKKTMENAGLIFDLNDIRKKNKQDEKNLTQKYSQLEAYQNEIIRLNKELQKYKKMEQQGYFDMNNHQTDRKSHEQLQQNDIQRFLNNNFSKSQSGWNKTNQIRIRSSSRGHVYKGANFDAKTLTTFDKAKMIDTMIENQQKQKLLEKLEKKYKNIKEAIQNHCQNKGCLLEANYSFENSFQE